MKERRTQYEIYWEILVFCRTPRSFTGIIGRCDLNSKSGQEHIGFLVARGFLAKCGDEGRVVYVTTEKAADYIGLFTRLYQGLFEKDPGFRL